MLNEREQLLRHLIADWEDVGDSIHLECAQQLETVLNLTKERDDE